MEKFPIQSDEEKKQEVSGEFDEEKALFDMMTPEEQQRELVLREKLKADPSKIIEHAHDLLGQVKKKHEN